MSLPFYSLILCSFKMFTPYQRVAKCVCVNFKEARKKQTLTTSVPFTPDVLTCMLCFCMRKLFFFLTQVKYFSHFFVCIVPSSLVCVCAEIQSFSVFSFNDFVRFFIWRNFLFFGYLLWYQIKRAVVNINFFSLDSLPNFYLKCYKWAD